MKNTSRAAAGLLAVFVFFISCRPGNQKTKTAGDTTVMHRDTSVSIFEHLIVDNRKDPSCGMPVSAGIGDTAHYRNRVLGFCSKECKEAFRKNPEATIAAADLKK